MGRVRGRRDLDRARGAASLESRETRSSTGVSPRRASRRRPARAEAHDAGLDGSESQPDGALRSDRGHVLAHASGMLHGGHPVTEGVRYILVCFVILKDFANFATRFYQKVRDLDPEHLEPLPPGIETKEV